MPPSPLPDPPTKLGALRRSCTRLQTRSVHRRMDLQMALAAADTPLRQRGTRHPLEVMAPYKVINASIACSHPPPHQGPC